MGMKTVNWEQLTPEQQTELLSRPAMADSSGLNCYCFRHYY